MRKHIFFLFLLFIPALLFAQTELQGKLTDTKGVGLPFATVAVVGTSKGTSTNLQGFFSLSLSQGKYVVEFRCIGYKSKKVNIEIGTEPTQKLNVSIAEDVFSLREVVVKADAEDPAYGIIREAQKKRQFYLEQEFESYRCKVYSKLFMKGEENNLNNLSFFGTQVQIREGVFYLSEALSEVSFQQKDKQKEKIISSLTSGDTSTYSKNYGVWLNFYRNRSIRLNTTSFASPIAADAMTYYDYKLEGVSEENGLEINKIKLIPKYSNAPAFDGYIYIIENTWRVHSIDASLSEAAAAPFSMNIRQIYTPITADSKGVWLPLNMTLSFQLRSSKAQGFYQIVTSDYELNPTFAEGSIGLQTLEIMPDSHRKDSLYWKVARPVPLTEEEQKDYLAKRILITRLSEKPVQDSIIKKQNPFNAAKAILIGYSRKNQFKNTEIIYPALLTCVNFNSVEGLVIDLPFTYKKKWASGQTLQLKPSVRYGFINQRPQAKMSLLWKHNPHKLAYLEIEGGRYISQWSGFDQIEPFVNTFTSLGGKSNLMKIYEKSFVALRYERELTNGFYASVRGEYARRTPWENNTNYSWSRKNDTIPYTRNIPQNLLTGSGEMHEASTDINAYFQPNNVLRFDVQLTFVPAQTYELTPEGKQARGSNFPTLTAIYSKGMADADFDLLRLRINDTWRFGRFGMSRFTVESGIFLNNNKVFFPDFQHFAGNQIGLLQSTLPDRNFQLLNYYLYSTNDRYLQAHLQHRFGGWLTDYIPLFKLAQTELILSANYLHTPLLGNYTEVGVGLGRLLRVLRLDWWNSFSDLHGRQSGFTLGAGF